jgi:hypothetical protein
LAALKGGSVVGVLLYFVLSGYCGTRLPTISLLQV